MEPQEHWEEIDLHKYWLILQRRWLVVAGIFGVVFTIALMQASSQKPTYQALASLLIKPDRASSLTGLGGGMGQVATSSEKSPSETQAKIITSVPVIEATIQSPDLKNAQGQPLTLGEVSSKLQVETTKGTDVLQISYIDYHPEVAASVVNRLIDIYISKDIEENRRQATSAREFIEAQLPKTERAVKDTESKLREFKEENQVIVLQEEANSAVGAISRLEDEIAKARAELVDVTAKATQLRSQAGIKSSQALALSTLTQTEGIQKLLTQLQEAQSQLAIEQSRFQPGHPTVINLEEKVAALQSLLNQRLEQTAGTTRVSLGNLQVGEMRQTLMQDYVKAEGDRIGLEQKIAKLSQLRTNYISKASVLPKLEQKQRELEREQKAAQTTYETLLTRYQEIQVAERQRIGNVQIISKALPGHPAGSRTMMILAAGGVAGMVLGVIVAFALDLIDSSVKTVKEAKELFQYTLLGIIPSATRNGKNQPFGGVLESPIPKVIGRDLPYFPLSDAYQILQANLKFLSSDKKIKAIAVTSSVAKEGKSEVAANLAVAMAQVGHRVLLVDADMRHPIQHHIWGMTNAMGLSHIIVDQITIPGAIQEAMPNLYVLPAGVVPPNPLALLDSQRMAALVNTFAKNYDFVIFDTPTLTGTADAAVLGKQADGILLVVHPGVVSTASAKAAKEFLTQSGQKVLGMVMNGVNVKREPDSYFHYTRESAEPTKNNEQLTINT